VFTKPTLTKDQLTNVMAYYTTASLYSKDRNIGLELELEGFGAEAMGYSEFCKSFAPHRDPSLRGDCVELVLRRPCNIREIEEKVIPEFERLKEATRFKPSLSSRCSFHVHLDFSHRTLYTFVKFLTLYALYEPHFFEVVGSERKGNHFCLRLMDSPKYVKDTVDGIKKVNFQPISGENLRYMALNLQSLWKFGSVEIRLHEGVSESKEILRWLHVLMELVTFAENSYDFKPDEIIYAVSGESLPGFTMRHLPLTHEFVKEAYAKVSYRESVDIAQDYACAVDWVNAPTEGAAPVTPVKKARITSRSTLPPLRAPLQPQVDNQTIGFRLDAAPILPLTEDRWTIQNDPVIEDDHEEEDDEDEDEEEDDEDEEEEF